MVLGTAMQTYGEQLAEQQEVLMAAADIVIDAYGSESAVARAGRRRTAATRLHVAAARVFVNDAAVRVDTPPERRSRRWRTATRFARSSPRCGGC